MARVSDTRKQRVPDLFGEAPNIPPEHDEIAVRLFDAATLKRLLCEIYEVPPARLALRRRTLEHPLHESVRGGLNGRVAGFADVYSAHEQPGDLSTGARADDVASVQTLFEIKSKWEGIGNMLRQLRYYQCCEPKPNCIVVVGPDDSMSKLLAENGFVSVVYGEDGFRAIANARQANQQFRNPA